MTDANAVSPRELDFVVLGATGLTGRLVVAELAGIDNLLPRTDGRRRWAVAGRDRGRIATILADLSLGDVDIIEADLEDVRAFRALARRTTVVLNLAGPYTDRAPDLIGACIEAATSYVDLSGEIPLLRRVIDRFDVAARRAGVQVVQMAGWEAMPADVATLVACKRAAAPGSDNDGPGAAAPIADIVVSISFERMPAGGVPFRQSVSAGTMASMVAMLDDTDAGLIGRADALLPAGAARQGGSRPGRMRFGATIDSGRSLGPAVPVAFLNPPIIHRTAALLAGESGVAYRPAIYREGFDAGGADGVAALRRRMRSAVEGSVQRLVIGLSRLPIFVRRAGAARLRKLLPAAGTGPSGRYLTDWSWTVQARATAHDGAVGVATITGVGHPGYTATAAIIVEVALSIADRDHGRKRAGCITPALAIGAAGREFRVSSLTLR